MVTMSEIIQQACTVGKLKMVVESNDACRHLTPDREIKEWQDKYNAAEQVLREMVELYKKQ